MKITSRFTVAVHTLLTIYYFGEKNKDTSDFIAQSVCVNPVVIRRTLLSLKAAGMVEVKAGSGGASIVKDLQDITLYDPAERVLEKLREGCSYITAPAEFDGCVAALMPLLQKRKESVESDQGRAWLEQQPPIILIISDLKACLEAASPDTARRLASILHLGAGLRVSVVVLARAQDRDDLCHAGDMFSIHLTNKADVVMVEGCLRDHGMFDTQLDYTEAGEPLAEGDAWLLQSGEARRIKCVEQA